MVGVVSIQDGLEGASFSGVSLYIQSHLTLNMGWYHVANGMWWQFHSEFKTWPEGSILASGSINLALCRSQLPWCEKLKSHEGFINVLVSSTSYIAWHPNITYHLCEYTVLDSPPNRAFWNLWSQAASDSNYMRVSKWYTSQRDESNHGNVKYYYRLLFFSH